MAKSYDSKLFKPSHSYEGSDDKMLEYLTSTFSGTSEYNKKNTLEFSKVKQKIDLNQFKSSLLKISDQLVFRGNFGAYNDKLEKQLSLTKKSIKMDSKSCKNLYMCFDDLFRYNKIRDENFEKIKYATLFVKYKSGDTHQPSNFRYLSNHHKNFKIIDKFWTNNIINILRRTKSLPDSNIVTNTLVREFSMSIRDLAIDKVSRYHKDKKIVLLDIKKAFDSVTWDVLEDCLLKNLTRKVNETFAKKMVEQYMFLNTNRSIKYNNQTVNFSKSVATGLPSSTLVFTLLIEQLIFEWFEKEKCKDELIINTYVDDIYLEFNKLDRAKELVKSLVDYLATKNLIINELKTKTNINSLNYPQLDGSDCYLGIPFAKNKKDYLNECITQFSNRYYELNINEIIDILESEDYTNVRKEILGFFNYKLYGFKIFGEEEINVLDILKKNKSLL